MQFTSLVRDRKMAETTSTCTDDPSARSSSSTGSTQGSDSDAPPRGAVSLLERLRAPQPSELSRKRKVHANPPPDSVGIKGNNRVTFERIMGETLRIQELNIG